MIASARDAKLRGWAKNNEAAHRWAAALLNFRLANQSESFIGGWKLDKIVITS